MTSTSVLSEAFRRAATMFPTGVAVVTSGHEDLVHGITVNAFSSLSLDPPQVLVCVSRWSKFNQLVLRSNAFAVNILSGEQAELSNHFAKSGREPVRSFDEIGIPSTVLHTGMPVLGGVAAYFDCVVVMACESGDHSVFMGDVLAADADESLEPLLYFNRKYRRIAADEG